MASRMVSVGFAFRQFTTDRTASGNTYRVPTVLVPGGVFVRSFRFAAFLARWGAAPVSRGLVMLDRVTRGE